MQSPACLSMQHMLHMGALGGQEGGSELVSEAIESCLDIGAETGPLQEQ